MRKECRQLLLTLFCQLFQLIFTLESLQNVTFECVTSLIEFPMNVSISCAVSQTVQCINIRVQLTSNASVSMSRDAIYVPVLLLIIRVVIWINE